MIAKYFEYFAKLGVKLMKNPTPPSNHHVARSNPGAQAREPIGPERRRDPKTNPVDP